MVHPTWQRLLPKLRQIFDVAGLRHIAIKERPGGDPLTPGELIDIYDTSDIYFDESVSFEPKYRRLRLGPGLMLQILFKRYTSSLLNSTRGHN